MDYATWIAKSYTYGEFARHCCARSSVGDSAPAVLSAGPGSTRIRPQVIVGHSLGGAVACQVAHHLHSDILPRLNERPGARIFSNFAVRIRLGSQPSLVPLGRMR